VVRLDRGTVLGQRRGRLWTRETARSGRARARRGEGGVGSAAAYSDNGMVRIAPPTAANQGVARGDTATDRWAPHIIVFSN
jgi:hypothetical protein